MSIIITAIYVPTEFVLVDGFLQEVSRLMMWRMEHYDHMYDVTSKNFPYKFVYITGSVKLSIR